MADGSRGLMAWVWIAIRVLSVPVCFLLLLVVCSLLHGINETGTSADLHGGRFSAVAGEFEAARRPIPRENQIAEEVLQFWPQADNVPCSSG